MRNLSILALLVLAACGEVPSALPLADGGSGGAGGSGSGGSGGEPEIELPPAAVTFRKCSVGGIDLICGRATLPLDPAEPAGRQIDVNVYRLSPDGEPSGQIWLLQGGPGSSGISLVWQARWFTAMGYEVFLPDYRGVGDSAPLVCGEVAALEGSTSAACLADIHARWGDDLLHFGTTDSARDIGQMMMGTRRPGIPLHVWAVSYGTLVANRLVHLFPDLADAVVLDSSCPPTGCVATGIDANMERTARKILDLCAEDAFCSTKLGGDPQALLDDLTLRVREGHCSAVKAGSLGTRDFLRLLLASTLTEPGTAFVGLSALHRMNRCDEADVAALENLAVSLRLQRRPDFDDVDGSPLGLYIVYSEFWDRTRRLADYEAADEELAVTAFSALSWAHRFESFPWPPIQVPEEQRTWAPSQKPVLLLEGSLDNRTPPEEVADFPQAHPLPFQYLVEVPYAAHGVWSSSQWIRRQGTCGMIVTRGFLTDPLTSPADGCMDQARPPDLRGPDSWAASLYGTTDLWENPDGQGIGAPDPAAEAMIARLRERLAAPPSFR